MATQNVTDSTASQDSGAPAPLGDRGSSEFSDLIGGSSPSSSSSQETQPTTQSSPTTSSAVPSKPADVAQPQSQLAAQQASAQQPAQSASQTPTVTNDEVMSRIVDQMATKIVNPLVQQQQAIAQQQTQQHAPAETPEQFNQRYGIQTYTAEHVTALLGQDPAKAAQVLNSLQQNTISAALRMANDIVEARLDAERKEYAPHISAWKEYQAQRANERAEADFYKSYPQLANEKDLVNEMKDAVIAKIQAGQLKFPDQTSAFKAVAAACERILARGRPAGSTPSGGATSQPQQTPQSQGRQMAAVSTAGTSGTGKAATPSDVEAVFGPDAR